MEWPTRIGIKTFEEIEGIMKDAPEKARAHWNWGKTVFETPPVDTLRGPGPAAALAHDPQLLYLWYLEEHHLLKEGRLPAPLKELITVVVDAKNQCQGCVKWHSASAKVEGAPEEKVAIARDFERRKDALPDKERKTIEFAVKVSTDHTRVTDRDMGELRELGYTDSDIVEIVAVALIAERFAKFNAVLSLSE